MRHLRSPVAVRSRHRRTTPRRPRAESTRIAKERSRFMEPAQGRGSGAGRPPFGRPPAISDWRLATIVPYERFTLQGGPVLLAGLPLSNCELRIANCGPKASYPPRRGHSAVSREHASGGAAAGSAGGTDPAVAGPCHPARRHAGSCLLPVGGSGDRPSLPVAVAGSPGGPVGVGGGEGSLGVEGGNAARGRVG